MLKLILYQVCISLCRWWNCNLSEMELWRLVKANFFGWIFLKLCTTWITLKVVTVSFNSLQIHIWSIIKAIWTPQYAPPPKKTGENGKVKAVSKIGVNHFLVTQFVPKRSRFQFYAHLSCNSIKSLQLQKISEMHFHLTLFNFGYIFNPFQYLTDVTLGQDFQGNGLVQ